MPSAQPLIQDFRTLQAKPISCRITSTKLTVNNPPVFRKLAPAPPKSRYVPNPPPPIRNQQTNFYDLPAELRIEIYKLALVSVTIHVLPLHRIAPGHLVPKATSTAAITAPESRLAATHPRTPWKCPHALCRTSRQVRHEVLPLIHAHCPIYAQVTNFDFDGMLAWLAHIPPDDQRHLLRNSRLHIHLNYSLEPQKGNLESFRKWLHLRADICRPQANWMYLGPRPSGKVETDLRRRVKRMREKGKRDELLRMMRALGVRLHEE